MTIYYGTLIWSEYFVYLGSIIITYQMGLCSESSRNIQLSISTHWHNPFMNCSEQFFKCHYLMDLMWFAFNTQVFHCSNFSITYTVFCRYKTCVINFLLYFFVWLLSKRAFMRIAIFVYILLHCPGPICQ